MSRVLNLKNKLKRQFDLVLSSIRYHKLSETITDIAYSSIYGEHPTLQIFIKDKIDIIRHHHSLKFYIPLNVSESIYSYERNFDLEEKTYEFLNSNVSTLLLLGDSGSGKSTFCTHLSIKLIEDYRCDNNNPLPVLIRLGFSLDATKRGRLIESEFYRFGLSSTDIASLKKSIKFIFILDGYDELNEKINIVAINKLSEWNAKIIITCRTQYLENNEDYAIFSKVDPSSYKYFIESYKILYIIPFSEKNIDCYLMQYVKSGESKWDSWKIYKSKILKIYNLIELSTNPLFLSIITQTLPNLIEIQYTMECIYQKFIEQWFEREKIRLKIIFDKEFFFEFAEELAFEMFISNKLQVKITEKKSLFNKNQKKLERLIELFTIDHIDVINARSGCPIHRSGDGLYSFMHKSYYEYFTDRKLYVGINKSDFECLNKKNIAEESGIIYFLSEMQIDKDNLLQCVCDSKKNHKLKTISSNAATILNAKKISFSALDLSGIQIPGANLSEAILHATNLSNSDLSCVNFKNAFLNNADFSNCKMEFVKFEENPCFEGHSDIVSKVRFSSNGKLLASSDKSGEVKIWDMDKYQHIGKLSLGSSINNICFKDDSALIIVTNYKIIKWNIKDGKAIDIWKNSCNASKICFNSDFSLFAGIDNTNFVNNDVKLWSGKDGNLIKKFNNNKLINALCLNNEGSILAIAYNHAIVLLDTKTGTQIKTLNKLNMSIVNVICFSHNSSLLAIGEFKNIHIWDIQTGKHLYNLNHHSHDIVSLDFNSNSSILACGSHDNTISLWDVHTGSLIDKLQNRIGEGQIIVVTSISFNHDGSLLASGDSYKTIRLWNISSKNTIKKTIGHNNIVMLVRFNFDGTELASLSWDGLLKIWNVKTGKLLQIIEDSLIRYNDAYFDYDILIKKFTDWDAVQLFDIYRNEYVTLWGTKSNIYPGSGYATNVFTTPDGSLQITGCLSGLIKIMVLL